MKWSASSAPVLAMPPELVVLAVMSAREKWYAPAYMPAAVARFIGEAFAEAPGLADDLRRRLRYIAACAAALAAAGKGKDTASIDLEGRNGLRRQALTWLRADLAAWVGALDSNPAARGDVWKALTLWRVDPDLACVRDPGELDELAEDERKEYLALWAEVAAVLARIEK